MKTRQINFDQNKSSVQDIKHDRDLARQRELKKQAA